MTIAAARNNIRAMPPGAARAGTICRAAASSAAVRHQQPQRRRSHLLHMNNRIRRCRATPVTTPTVYEEAHDTHKTRLKRYLMRHGMSLPLMVTSRRLLKHDMPVAAAPIL